MLNGDNLISMVKTMEIQFQLFRKDDREIGRLDMLN
jgi:hypothetical protein